MKLIGNISKWLGITLYAVCAVVILLFLTSLGGWKALNVLTGSMRPIIQPGALVLIHRVPLHDIHPGNIVTYQNPRNFKETITHRVQKIEKVNGVATVTVKGDANPTADKPFPGGLIVGRVALIVPGAGKIINYLHNPYGLAALVIIPGVLVIWGEARRLHNVLASNPKKSAAPRPQVPEPEPAPAEEAVEPKKAEVVEDDPKPVPKPTARPVRSLDGMRRLSMLIAVPAILCLAIGSTYALGSVGTVKLTHNTFTAVAATNSPTVPTSADQCKKEGWKEFKNIDGGPLFKNQGQCVSFVESHKHDHDQDNNNHDNNKHDEHNDRNDHNDRGHDNHSKQSHRHGHGGGRH